jgi:hypothetical protein
VTIYGWDLSHYDGPDSRDAVGQGFSFFTHKAGGDANDAELGTWWDLMKDYRLRALLGAYWVQYPGNPVTRADMFISRLDSQCPGWRDGPFILQVDCEIWGGDRGTLPGKADIKAFCDRLRVRCPKLVPVVYAPKWCYGDTLTGLGYPLWASSYVAGSGAASALYPGDNSSKWAAYSGQVPAILQFTSSAVIAGQTTCDANAYRGTLDQLTALLAPGWIAEIDDMSEQDATSALTKFFAPSGDPADGTYTTRIGRDALNQSVPNPFAGGKTSAWQLMQNTASSAQRTEQVLGAILAGVQFENAEVPAGAQAIADAVLAELDSRTPEQTAAALVAVLGPDVAAQVAQLMIGSQRAMAVGDENDIYTRTARESTHQRIEGSGE